MDNIPYGYCHCGCGQRAPIAKKNAPRSGVRRGEPYRFVAKHHLRLMRKSVRWIEEDRGYATSCWVWQLKVGDNGYGHLTVEGGDRLAHRYYYELRFGPIADGLTLDHLCAPFGGPRSCVNPDHLEPVPVHINQRRGRRTVLNEELVASLREQKRAGATYAELERRTGIKRRTIRAAVNAENWSK